MIQAETTMCTTIAATLFTCSLGLSVSGQDCLSTNQDIIACDELECCDNADTDVNDAWALPTTSPFIPNTVPGVFLKLYERRDDGIFDNEWGMASWWYDNDIDETSTPQMGLYEGTAMPQVFVNLLNRLDDKYDRGFRRIGLWAPAGNPAAILASEPGGTDGVEGRNWPTSTWAPMRGWRRQAFIDHLSVWMNEHPDVALSIYNGNRIENTCTIPGPTPWDPCAGVLGWNACQVQMESGTGETGTGYPKNTDPEDMKIYCQFIRPWMELGVDRIWLDTGASTPDLDDKFGMPIPGSGAREFAKLQYSGDYWDATSQLPRIEIAGEGLPSGVGIDVNAAGLLDCSNDDLDLTAMSHVAFIANWRIWERKARGIDPKQISATHNVPLEFNALFAGFRIQCTAHERNGEVHNIDDIWEYHQRGFVLWSSETLRYMEGIQGVVGMGTISNGANFDFSVGTNGLSVDQDDLNRYIAQWDEYSCGSDPEFDYEYYHGDIDNNGIIDWADRHKFQGIYRHGLSVTNFNDYRPLLVGSGVPDFNGLEICSPANVSGPEDDCMINIDDLTAVITAMGMEGSCMREDCRPENPDGSLGNGIINIDDLVFVVSEIQ